MIMFSTQTEVTDYLVAQGTHKGLAKAMVREYLTYDNTDDNDNLQRYNEELDDAEAFTMTESEVLDFKRTNGDDDFAIEVVDGVECITFDGEPMCDLEGNLL